MMNDLTVGKPEAVLWKFCMPLFGSIGSSRGSLGNFSVSGS